MKPTLTATIERGAKTNRVKVKRSHNRPAEERQPQRALARFRRDPEVQGLVTVAIGICMPTGELASLDELCEQLGMARSHLIRQAVKAYRERQQERLWRKAMP